MNAKQQYQDIIKNLCASSKYVVEELQEVQGKLYSGFARGAVYGGVCLGQKGKTFRPSTQLLEELKESAQYKTWLNKKGEFLFTCGRDAWKENIIRTMTPNGKITLLLNQYDEPLGIGMFKDGKVERLYDIGDYLRRERRKKKPKTKY